jgi:NAD(P)-dependent dehydrogenase (short-subunit alcohol dehydrogenase family)
VLVNNAGVNVKQRTLTADGIELNFAVNYLAPFLLTLSMVDVLEASAPARIINVASAAEQMGRIDFDDLMASRGYSALRAYCQSKLATVLFTYELARHLEPSHVTVNCLHPGVIRTKITQGMSGWGAVIAWLGRPFAATPERGAETIGTAIVAGRRVQPRRNNLRHRTAYSSVRVCDRSDQDPHPGCHETPAPLRVGEAPPRGVPVSGPSRPPVLSEPP